MEVLIYSLLGEVDARDGSLLKWGGDDISRQLRPYSLFVLRNGGLAASLDQMRQQRRGAFLDKFKHIAAIKAKMMLFVPEMKAHLAAMKATGANRFNQLDMAYGAGGVVKTSTTRTTAPNATSITKVNPVSTITSAVDTAGAAITSEIETEVFDTHDPSNPKPVQSQKTPRTVGVPATYQGGKWNPEVAAFETQTVETRVVGTQDMVSELPAYSHPKLENEFGYRQAMVSVLPELLRQETTELKLNDLDAIMGAELAAMDLEVRTLQLNYVHTHLTSPLDGLITGIFKDVGETVEPGEPVLRIENDRKILIVGRVQYQGVLYVGRTFTIDLKSVFEDGTTKSLPGTVVAIRGHENDNDEWDIIVKCDNLVDAGGRPLLPLNYHFDPDTDSFTVT
ncbi:HlyD family secretion protein [Rhizobium leguminosarum]|uniref:HlyD family secretion protein n=1 Tax=Rhizobium leguminosarum TaxID=384 RepID=UPI0013F145D6|nr:HlyD family secretion protein [Rhizobium leguminosarum]